MLVRYGTLVSQASGNLAGIQFAKRAGAPIVRARPRRVAQNTEAQTAQRVAYTTAVAHWRILPPLTQLAWTLYAAKNQRQNRLGVWRRLTGMQFFFKEALVRIRHNMGYPGSPPTYGQQGIGTPHELSFWEGGPYTVSFASPTVDPHGWYLFTGHRPMSKVAWKKPYYRVLPAQYVEHSGSWDLFAPWAAAMGEMAAGELFVIQVRYTGMNSLTSAAATWHSVVSA